MRQPCACEGGLGGGSAGRRHRVTWRQLQGGKCANAVRYGCNDPRFDPSLRKTRLDRAALIDAVSCGLPGTQMPGWLDGAYTQRSCYGFPPGPAPDGTTLTPVLSANEVEALADYLLAKIVGR